MSKVTLVGSPPSRPDSPIQYPEHPSRKLSYPDRTGEPTRKISASKSEYPAAVETTTIRQRYDSTEDCRPQINGGPRATKDITDFSKADILTISMNDLTSRVPGMLGLAFIFSGFVYLAMFCLVRWFLWSDDGFVLLPVMILSWAGATDMYRLFLGVLLGESGLSSRLSTYTYIYEFSALPLLWITLAQIFSYMSGWWLITVIMKPLAIAFGVNGFNGFMSGIQGEYLVTSDGGVWRHTVNPFTVPYSLIIQPVMIAVAGLLLGFLSLCIYGDALSFLIQVACFAGQALATREPNVGQYFASGLEIIFLANLVYMYIIVI